MLESLSGEEFLLRVRTRMIICLHDVHAGFDGSKGGIESSICSKMIKDHFNHFIVENTEILPYAYKIRKSCCKTKAS